MCVVCHRRGEKEKLLRVTVKDGRLLWDRKMVLGGRGAYLCPAEECVRRIDQRKVMQKLFRFLRQFIDPEEVCRVKREIYEHKGWKA